MGSHVQQLELVATLDDTDVIEMSLKSQKWLKDQARLNSQAG
jgi:hypothetical protein